jgi:DNA invertase Pin-like site-specific DNA recombinase
VAKIGYGRVSKRDQNPDAQHGALTKASCVKIFIDEGVSGKLAKRPKLDSALEFLREGDTLVITKLDRLGRFLKNLIELAGDLEKRGVDLLVIDQNIDTTSPAGKLFFHIVGAFAQVRTRHDLRTDQGRPGSRPGPRPNRRPQTQTERQAGRPRPPPM